MVLLARWILANNPHARVAIVTDRDELDKQIMRVFAEAGESIYRTSSGRDLMHQLGQASPRLLCSLVHKFGLGARGKKEHEFEAFIAELQAQPSPTLGSTSRGINGGLLRSTPFFGQNKKLVISARHPALPGRFRYSPRISATRSSVDGSVEASPSSRMLSASARLSWCRSTMRSSMLPLLTSR